MKTRNFIFGVVFLVLILAIVLVTAKIVSIIFLPNNSNDEVKRWKQQAEKLQEENITLKKANENLETLLSSAQKEADKLERKLSASEKKNKTLSEQLGDKSKHPLGNDNDILSLLFPKMKYPYEIRDKTMQFFSHPSCKEKYLINRDLTFAGYADCQYEYYSEGVKHTYFVSKSNEKGYVFSKRQPILYSIK